VKELVEKRVEVPARWEDQSEWIRHCDKCEVILDPQTEESNFANVLEIYCNLEQCVNDRVKMDLCTDCLKPIWEKICEAIGADPNDELRIGQDDDW
jgi:hypothetical protein